jgi:hypothetical protein
LRHRSCLFHLAAVPTACGIQRSPDHRIQCPKV